MIIYNSCYGRALVVLIFFMFGFSVRAQEKVALTIAHDSIIGRENLPLNNGTFHVNTYRVINEKNRYYNNEYQLGEVHYDGFTYYKVPMKYDVTGDVLVVKPFGTSGNVGVNLIRQKLDFFILENKRFINLEKIDTGANNIGLKGIYEEHTYSSNFKLYIKHIKKAKSRQDQAIAYHEFETDQDFIFYENGQFTPVSSRKDVQRLFPDMKGEIREFFRMNRDLEKTNEIAFYKNLFSFIYQRYKK